MPELLAPKHDSNARNQTYRHAAGRADPATVEGVLQEIRDADQHCCNPNAVQPM